MDLFYQITVFHLIFSIDGNVFVSRNIHHTIIGREGINSNTVILWYIRGDDENQNRQDSTVVEGIARRSGDPLRSEKGKGWAVRK
jgi:hypothetical protein